MENASNSLIVYNRSIELIEEGNYKAALNNIKINIDVFKELEEISLAYLNCGFINYKLEDYNSAIEDFSEAIKYEEKLDFLTERSKDISFNARSNSKYRIGDYKGAIEDKRKAKKIQLIENNKLSGIEGLIIDYKKLLLGHFYNKDCIPKYKLLSEVSKVRKSKYDLIDDYKKVIDNQKIDMVIEKLEILSDKKFKNGDYKGSIKSLIRAEKYYY